MSGMVTAEVLQSSRELVRAGEPEVKGTPLRCGTGSFLGEQGCLWGCVEPQAGGTGFARCVPSLLP